VGRPVIALLTDFGSRDHYVGAMKGVVLGICPDAALVDITHDIPPHDILAGALELVASYKYFPVGTVFLVVVDPGVGSSRHAMAAEADGYLFVAPDNGVLSPVFTETPPGRVVAVTERRYARALVSRTFEGRDRLAPAAAWLGQGTDLAELGVPLSMWQTLSVAEPVVSDRLVTGEVLRVDRFGNLVTNIDRRAFDRVTSAGGIAVTVGDHLVGRVVATYSDVESDSVCALFGSSEHLEIAVNGSSAADRLQLARGARVMIGPSCA
jgi:S-adenosylmethionine hydrolase